MVSLKEKVKSNSVLIRYLIYSMIVTVLDLTAVYVMIRVFKWSLINSNTFGVILGFIVHYILSSKKVFNTDYGFRGFIIYLGTFILGLFIANFLIYVSYEYIFQSLNSDVNLLLSKGISVVLPFFFLYYFRKFLYKKLKIYNEFKVKEKIN